MNSTNSKLPDISIALPTDFKLKRRSYLHFDVPISHVQAKTLLLSPSRVASHSFFPFLTRKLIIPRYKKALLKVNKKVRGIAFASHSDAAIYQYYNYMLSEKYELYVSDNLLSETPTAYRRFMPSKCNIHFAREAFDFIGSCIPCVVICCDVKGFFDNIDHDLLKSSWCKVMGVSRLPEDHFKVFRSITKYGRVSEKEVKQVLGLEQTHGREIKIHRFCSPVEFRTKIRASGLIHTNVSGRGIPQGSPISGLLSNIYMLPFDQEMESFVTQRDGLIRRYSDDILVILPIQGDENPEDVIAIAEKTLEKAIKGVALEFQSEKVETYRCHFETGVRFSKEVQYLGLCFDGKSIRIRSQTLSRYYARLARYLKRSKKIAQKNPAHPRVFRNKLHKKYTHLGRRNFIGYAYRCAEICESPAARKQVANHMRIIKRKLSNE